MGAVCSEHDRLAACAARNDIETGKLLAALRENDERAESRYRNTSALMVEHTRILGEIAAMLAAIRALLLNGDHHG